MSTSHHTDGDYGPGLCWRAVFFPSATSKSQREMSGQSWGLSGAHLSFRNNICWFKRLGMADSGTLGTSYPVQVPPDRCCSMVLVKVIRASLILCFLLTLLCRENSSFLTLAAMCMHKTVQLIASLLIVPADSSACLCSWAVIPLTVALPNPCLVYIWFM